MVRIALVAFFALVAALACSSAGLPGSEPSAKQLAEMELRMFDKADEIQLYADHMRRTDGNENCVAPLQELQPREQVLDRASVTAIAREDYRELYDIMEDKVALYDEFLEVLRECTGIQNIHP